MLPGECLIKQVDERCKQLSWLQKEPRPHGLTVVLNDRPFTPHVVVTCAVVLIRLSRPASATTPRVGVA